MGTTFGRHIEHEAAVASTPTALSVCRICGHRASLEILHRFGAHPVAGYLETSAAAALDAPRYALDIVGCRRCGLVQQSHDEANRVLAERVYVDYQPTYSMSAGVGTYGTRFLDNVERVAGLRPGDAVLEIGSNDGSILQDLARRGFLPSGFEPATRLSAAAIAAGLDVVPEFFGLDAALRYRESRPRVRAVVTRHTLEHAFAPVDFLAGISEVLDDDGTAVIEVPYLHLQAMHNQFQSFALQHVSFFTVQAMQQALARAGLTASEVRFVDMDGGSMVVVARKHGEAGASVRAALELERELALDRPEGLVAFFARFESLRARVPACLDAFSRAGLPVVAYGAGSKGQSLLNMLGLGRRQVPVVVDDTPGHAGRWVPGPAIPVVASDDAALREARVVFVTAPTHAREIAAKERLRLDPAVRFFVTAPDFHCMTE